MGPRVQEFHHLLEANGFRPDALECRVCKAAGRGLAVCFAEDVAAGGGRYHLRKLWSVALAVGTGLTADLWEEVSVPGGAIRLNYVDGSVELCRGEPPSLGEVIRARDVPAARQRPPGAERSAERAPERASPAGRRKRAPRETPATCSAVSASAGASGSAGSAPRVSLSPPSRVRPERKAAAGAPAAAAASAGSAPGRPEPATASPQAAGSLASLGGFAAWRVSPVTGAEAEEDEREERVVLEGPRPLGLEIRPAEGSRGAVIRHSDGGAAMAGVERGATILSINDHAVEDLPTMDIQGLLDGEALPLTLDLRPPLDLPTVRRRKPRRRDPVTVSTANCRGSHRVVSEAVSHLGWLELHAPSDILSRVSCVVWLEHADPTEGLAPVQTVSRLEAFLHFCKKARLAQSLNAWAEELPQAFAFSPKTWVLPYDAGELKTAMTRGRKDETYIVKPTAGAQGKGIVLAKKWRDVDAMVQRSKASLEMPGRAPSEYVVQRYLADPLLLQGLKFDMRLYVVVTSVVPLHAYLFKEGLARFCTVPYEPPQEGNLREARMHLTNFAVNKKSKDFQPSEGVAQHDEGSKRSVSATLQQIEQAYGASSEELWSKVARLAANTLMALRPGLVEFYVHEQPRPLHSLGPKGFQLIGLDVIIDGSLEPKLLELNANPSLSAVQPRGGAANDGACGDQGAEPAPAAAAAELEASAAAERTAERPVLARRSRSSAAIVVPQPGRPRGLAAVARRPGSAEPPAAAGAGPGGGSSSTGACGRLARCSRLQSKQRLGFLDARADATLDERAAQVTSELDLEIKRELVVQALLLTRPAPQNKVARLKKQWAARSSGDLLPLSDEGAWALAQQPSRAEAVRPDAPQRCPAFEGIDFEALVVPDVAEYSRAHLVLYRWWHQGCGQGRDVLGQAQVLRLLERGGLVGEACGALFPDRVTAQLWLSRVWRDLAPGSFGLSLPQFVCLVGRVGRMLAGDGTTADALGAPGRPSVAGVLEFTRRGLCSMD